MTKRIYTIIDPCYILAQFDWGACFADACCEVSPNDCLRWLAVFNHLVAERLAQLTDAKAWVKSTGAGDWVNQVAVGECIDEHYEFCADSGTVCVCVFDGYVREMLSRQPSCTYALIECDGEPDVVFNCANNNWTVLHITDAAGNRWVTRPAK